MSSRRLQEHRDLRRDAEYSVENVHLCDDRLVIASGCSEGRPEIKAHDGWRGIRTCGVVDLMCLHCHVSSRQQFLVDPPVGVVVDAEDDLFDRVVPLGEVADLTNGDLCGLKHGEPEGAGRYAA